MVSLWACWLLISVCIIVRAVVKWFWFVGSSRWKAVLVSNLLSLVGFGCAWADLLDLGRTRIKLLLLLKNLGASQKILTTAVNFLLEGTWSLTENIGPMFRMIWDVNCLCLPWAWVSVHCHCAELKKKKHPPNPKSSSQEQRSSALGLCVCFGAVSALAGACPCSHCVLMLACFLLQLEAFSKAFCPFMVAPKLLPTNTQHSLTT